MYWGAKMNKERYIKELKTYRHLLPKQTIKTLRGQALSGDLEGAKKGLVTAIKKQVSCQWLTGKRKCL